MTDPIQIICSLTGCTEEEANHAYNNTQDVVEAVDLLLVKVKSPADKYIESKKIKREITEEEKIIGPYRAILKEFDEKMSTSLSQHGHEGSVLKLDHHEEMVQQNNCSQICQLPSLGEEVQKQEIVCQLQSECSYGSQSNDQILPCSDHQCLQLSQDQGKE